ncbi:MAG TPA: class I SAM-dependent methyltransferase [Chloroflexota bacterium]|nr:class I SAM-dependent methyltransferase [Chloroflexota bacterium]
MNDSSSPSDPEAAYDAVAVDYAAHYYHELQHKPFDRAILGRLAVIAGPLGPICDLGCGPGQIARYLHDHGADAIGLDLSSQMVAEAQRLNPDIAFRQGTMLALPYDDSSLGGIAAFYSIIHIPPVQRPAVFAEMWRVLRPGGAILIAFHLGDEVVHRDEWWGHPISLDGYLLKRPELEEEIREAGFHIVESRERDPNPAVENPTRRAYILAQKPAGRAPRPE